MTGNVALAAQPSLATLVDVLRWRAEHQTDRVAYRFLPDGESREVAVTYGELDRLARGTAAVLQAERRRGDRVLLIYPSGLEFIAAFFGCLYAGTVAIVLAPPVPSRLSSFQERLAGVCRDASSSLALTTTGVLESVVPGLGVPLEKDAVRWLVMPGGGASASDWRPPALTGSELAFLQYTSGSTSEPRGVMVTHGSLIHNLRLIEAAFLQPPDSESVCWLPPHHDMGLIGGILAPLYLGTTATLMPPAAFVQRPARWLRAVSRYRAAVSGGPNFAYDQCLRRISPEQRADLDLSNWEVAFTGAEPIHPETLRAFADCFAPCGFRRSALKPCYGLAEATLMVSTAPGRAPAVIRSFRRPDLAGHHAVPSADADPAGVSLPSSGRPSEVVVIVDPESGAECPAGVIGEIWVSGPSVALGYWNRPEETAATFGARLGGGGRTFLRTGDLGFLLDGELFVTGRLKDLIIIGGANHYPQDIERTVAACHPALAPAECAAFSVERDGREELVVIASPGRRAELTVESLQRAVRSAVAARHDLRLHELILVKTGRIPRTTSGKIRRSACRSGYLSGDLELWEQP